MNVTAATEMVRGFWMVVRHDAAEPAQLAGSNGLRLLPGFEEAHSQRAGRNRANGLVNKKTFEAAYFKGGNGG